MTCWFFLLTNHNMKTFKSIYSNRYIWKKWKNYICKLFHWCFCLAAVARFFKAEKKNYNVLRLAFLSHVQSNRIFANKKEKSNFEKKNHWILNLWFFAHQPNCSLLSLHVTKAQSQWQLWKCHNTAIFR